jgi:hypothetical protein
MPRPSKPDNERKRYYVIARVTKDEQDKAKHALNSFLRTMRKK